MSNKYVLILADGINTIQRNQIQAEITKQSKNWWHDFLDVWIVETDEPVSQWRDRLRIIVGIGGDLIVIGLPHAGRRSWAMMAESHKSAWFKKHLINKPKQPDDEPPF